MGIFYLEINKKGNFQGNLPDLAKYNLKKFILYRKANIFLAYILSNNRHKPFLLENDSKLLLVHGHSPGITLDNYKGLNSLYGNFNIITINKEKNTFDFVKDYTNSFDSFLFQDEEKIIITNNPLLISKKGVNLDYLSIAQYLLHYQGLFPGNYFFKEICKIEPGIIITLQPDFSLKIEKKRPDIRKSTFVSFHKSFNEIITKSIKSNGNYSADLTGGYDTRLITACLLKNKLNFISVVHGEDDEEVKFVQKIANKLNLELKVLRIGGQINSVLNDWKRYFFLCGGLCNFFEILKEGSRSFIRTTFSNYKVGGGLGEVLRDKWYVNKIHRSRLSETALHQIITEKLLDSEEVFNFCTEEFKFWLDKYKSKFKIELYKYLKNNESSDMSQVYVYFIFQHYVQGWIGCLYNFHNNLISTIAPFMDNQFYLNCLYVDDNFRKNASGMTRSINIFYPKFKKLPFIDGQKCIPVEGINLARYLFHRVFGRVRKKIFSYSQKKDYNHANWLKTLLIDSEFKTKIEKTNQSFDNIISNSKFKSLITQGLKNQLNRSQYDFLWKLISLKMTLEYD